MNTSWHSYPKVFAIGHKAIEDIFLDEVLVEEKIDGSQFSFGRFDGVLRIRSKGVEMNIDAPEKMFQCGVDTVKNLDLEDGWTYRAELLRKPKHNTIKYGRVPAGNIIIFDINIGEEKYLSIDHKAFEAQRLGLELVPQLFYGKINSPDDLLKLLDTESILGNSEVEGIVIKNYHRFGIDKKVLMGKYVSEKFKEIHGKEWKDKNPKQGDIIVQLIERYKTNARWDKSIQHLAERGELESSPQDIGKLLLEIKQDIKTECSDEIKDLLFKWAIENILRGSVSGFPEYYKRKLLDKQFEEGKE